MKIYIHKNNQQSEAFEESEISERLRRGELSPDDLAVREGESEWKPLRQLLNPQMLMAGSAFPTVATASAAPVAAVTKGKVGCRPVLGALMLVVGILGLLGGFAGVAVSLSLGEPPVCKLADRHQAEAREALQKYESNPTLENTEKVNSAQKGAEYSSRACGEALDYYRWVRVALIIAAVLGLISAIVGYFLRR